MLFLSCEKNPDDPDNGTNSNTGWTVGVGNTILETVDDGTNRIPQASGASNDLLSVYFTDFNIGWAAGLKDNYDGKILNTVNIPASITSVYSSLSDLIDFFNSAIYSVTAGPEKVFLSNCSAQSIMRDASFILPA